MSENRKSKKRKIQELLQDLLENSKKKTSDNLGPEVHCDILDLLSVFLSKGLDADGRKTTLEKYPILKGGF
ncbi:unnamed protein product [Acanthoscelides obtectus]|uniref:Uncharacterized protein n=1 Tax=Acanthoscelides obtectus TaxID=200917 RepID=A0A9P0P5U8_ACAOB|nr:unnamed protein product [Acanthoscelides obtectus]CAK1622708.1 hypothetical protein AOBTE_LOCUS1633 [Acanthoscelides obtectus]